MPSKPTVAFLTLGLTAAIVACSNLGQTTGVNVGPNFPSKTLYASNSNQNAISIYSNSAKTGSGPAFQIGGPNTTLNGPQYIAFDRHGNLWVTNYNPSTNKALLIEFEALATGNVLPLITTPLTGRPRGIAFTPKTSPSPMAKGTASPTPIPNLMAITGNIPTETYPNRIFLFIPGATTPYQSIGGPKPMLKLPGGVAIDPNGYIYVTNIQGAMVEQFALPSPVPTKKPTATPSPTPTPTTTPSGSPSPTPTPTPTPTPINISPRFTLGPANDIITPVGIGLDQSGNIYIADQGKPKASCTSTSAPAILVFPPYNAKHGYTKPIRKIQGCLTKLKLPTDVKVDPAGITYVADTSASGAGIIYIFPAAAGGPGHHNVPPTNYTSPGAVTGLGIVP